MTAKEKLTQSYYTKKHIEIIKDRIAQLESILEGYCLRLKEDKVKEQANPHRFEDTMVALLDYKKEMDGCYKELIKNYQETEALINQLEDEKYKLLLTYRYMENLTWETISEKMNYDVRWIYVLHKKALKVIQVS